MNAKLWAMLGGVAVAILGGCRFRPNDPSLAQTADGKACPPEAVVEDGEDGNNQVLVQDDRNGYVYTYSDAAGSTIDPPGGAPFTMSPGGVNGSGFALRVHGNIASSGIVYAAMGMNFVDPKGPYDASRYAGISFYAKKGPGSTSRMRVKLPDVNTDPDGGVCGACSNDFGVRIRLTEEWQQFIIPFSQFRQESGWGNPRPPRVEHEQVYAVQFAVSDKGRPFDIWVDDVAFTGCP